MILSFNDYKRYVKVELTKRDINNIPDLVLDHLVEHFLDLDFPPSKGADYIAYDYTYGTLDEVYDEYCEFVKDYDQDEEFERKETLDEFLTRLGHSRSIIVLTDDYIVYDI